jgi:hypothetical protein
MTLTRALLPLLLAAPFCFPPTSAAQQVPELGQGTEGHLVLLGANTILGAATAAGARLVRGDPILPGLLRGAAGGALAYGGKRMVVSERFGAGMAGRQLALVGSSLVSNEAAGRGALDRVALGFGPLRFYPGRDVPSGERWRVDVVGAASLLYAAIGTSGYFDPGLSLSTGAIVRLNRDGHAFAAPGVLLLPVRDRFTEPRRYLIAHESVHVLQYDQAHLFWSDAAEAWLWDVLQIAAPRRVEFNLLGLLVALAIAQRVDHARQPWEMEAIFLADHLRR